MAAELFRRVGCTVDAPAVNRRHDCPARQQGRLARVPVGEGIDTFSIPRASRRNAVQDKLATTPGGQASRTIRCVQDFSEARAWHAVLEDIANAVLFSGRLHLGSYDQGESRLR